MLFLCVNNKIYGKARGSGACPSIRLGISVARGWGSFILLWLRNSVISRRLGNDEIHYDFRRRLFREVGDPSDLVSHSYPSQLVAPAAATGMNISGPSRQIRLASLAFRLTSSQSPCSRQTLVLTPPSWWRDYPLGTDGGNAHRNTSGRLFIYQIMSTTVRLFRRNGQLGGCCWRWASITFRRDERTPVKMRLIKRF